MKQSDKDVEAGRFLSYVLRHQPSAAGIELDANGWADVEALLAGCKIAGKNIDRASLDRIVMENGKQRYALNEDRTKIRANQGHSVPVDVELARREPPDMLYHGTASRFLASIRSEGILKRSRQHVHLSADERTALEVGNRHGQGILLRIDAAAMHRDGHPFYLSANGVWLCDVVPSKYISTST
ncbi:RNA 2'-phosphotransferase [Cohnella suwonensis]|uniref:Probable RNA 2'-phosphotransferase n=1 Tax=Cohnella suwonensis TaxID=696072 RepID=A0ABW0LSV2_9BACL